MRKFYFVVVFMLVFCSAGVVFSADVAKENVWSQVFPDGLILADGSQYDLDNLGGKMVGLYFAAGWCRNCCAFSKIFVPFRNKYKENFEVILVNFDDQEKEMMSYMQNYNMSWPAIPFDSEAREGMKKKYNISEIPTLIVFTPEGKVLTKDGRPEVQEMGDNAMNYWQDLASQVKNWSIKKRAN